MKKNMIIAAALVIAGLGATSITGALAASDNGGNDTAEMQGLMSAKLTAADAMKAAEATQPGKVSEVQFDLEKGVASYQVSILASDGTEHGFMVDATSGSVTKIAANEDGQHGGDNDSDGDNGENESGENQ